MLDAGGENETEILSLKTRFRANDILYGRLRPYLNKVHLAERDGICSTEIWVLRSTPDVLPEFAAYYLRSAPVCEKASQVAVGANLPRVPPGSFDRLPFPLPALSEQQRIVEVLRQAEGHRELGKQGDSLERKIYTALFDETFGNPALNPKKWPIQPFGKHVSYSRYGPRFPDAVYSEQGACILRTTYMESDGTIRWWESPRLTLSEKELNEYTLKPRTLLVSRSGTIGPVALFDGATSPCVAGAYLLEFGIRESLDPEYVRALFQTKYIQALMKKAVRSVAQPNLNAPSVKAIGIPIPPVDLQKDFAMRVAEFRRLKAIRQTATTQLINLQRELVAAAFTGELSKEWRARHQAELEKADAERAAALGRHGKRSVTFPEPAPAARESALARPARAWLEEQLSDFQRNIRLALYEWKGTVIPDDTEAFDDFCRQWPIEHQENAKDRSRRALEQLAALGLIAKVSLRNDNGDFVTGFRPLREDENTRLVDAQRITAKLAKTSGGQGGSES